MPYEIFEHTADIGLRVRAKDLPCLFKDAADGFYSFLTDLEVIRKIGPKDFREIEINFQETDTAELFMHWLQELLFAFSARRLIPLNYHFVTLTPVMVKMKAQAVRFDPEKYPSRHEIKAVTHHQFRVVREKSGWLAEVIFDI